MSMFDTVTANCPKCNKKVKFQSKAGKCELKEYTYDKVPICIAEDLSKTGIICTCGALIGILYKGDLLKVEMKIVDINSLSTEYEINN